MDNSCKVPYNIVIDKSIATEFFCVFLLMYDKNELPSILKQKCVAFHINNA